MNRCLNRPFAASHSRGTKLPCWRETSHWDKINKGNYHLKWCMSFVCTVPVQLFLSSMTGLCHKNGYSSCKGPPDNGHLIHKTCHCQVWVEPGHQYWISAVRPVVAPRNVGCHLRLQGLLIRIYCGETLTILQLQAESHLVCLLREAWWKSESDSHPREKLTRKKEMAICSHPKPYTPGSLTKHCYQISPCNITT